MHVPADEPPPVTSGDDPDLDLLPVVSRLLGESPRSASLVSRSAIAYDPFLAGRTVDLAEGRAVMKDGSVRSWSAVVKTTEGEGLRPARRELAIYQHGLAGVADEVALGGPRFLGAVEDGHRVELWVERLTDRHGGRWPIGEFGMAAHRMAGWVRRARDPDGWRDLDPEANWAARHGQPARVEEAIAELRSLASLPGADAVAHRLDDPDWRRIETLIAGTDDRIIRLEAFPTTMLHHDLVRANLFALTDGRIAAIDWEVVGPGPLGVDLVPLVVGSVRRGEASAGDLPRLERAVMDGYVATLGEDRAVEVQAAYRLALGLRWHVVLGAVRSALDPRHPPRRGSRPDEPAERALDALLSVAGWIMDRHR